MPKISYLISSYNAANYLDMCIRDLLNQTEQDFEIIVVDPQSPTNDIDIARKWAEKDSRIRPIDIDHYQTYGESWLTAWEFARSSCVANANTDDRRHPFFGEKLLAVMDAEKVAFAYPGIVVVNENGGILSMGDRQPFDAEAFSRECHAGPSVMWKTNLIEDMNMNVAYHRAKVFTSAFDYWLFLSFMSRGYIGCAVPGLLVTYVQRKDSIENSAGPMSTWQSLCAIAEFFPEALKRIATIEGNDIALQFEEWPLVPDPTEWVESMKKGCQWNGNELINLLEL